MPGISGPIHASHQSGCATFLHHVLESSSDEELPDAIFSSSDSRSLFVQRSGGPREHARDDVAHLASGARHALRAERFQRVESFAGTG